MSKIKILLVDDEYLALHLLEEFVGRLTDMEVIGKFKSPAEALTFLNNEEVDMLFLDIQMPGINGKELLKSLTSPPVTIFTTAYADHAVEAYTLNAVDYLLKPFSFERFLQAVNKAKEHLKSDQKTTLEQDFFTVKVDSRWQKIYYDKLLYVEGLREYVRFVCTDGRYVVLESMKNLEINLPLGRFMRVHKSFIIATDKVSSMSSISLKIGEHNIPISRSKKEEVKKAIFG